MKTKITFFVLLLSFLLFNNIGFAQKNSKKSTTMKKTITISNTVKPIGPYSPAILSGNTLYISGQIPINPFTGVQVKDDIKAETIQVMENIKALLKEVEMDFSNVVKATIYLSDMKNFAAISETYANYFSLGYPARECVQVAKLPLNANIEISVIAVK